MKKVNLMLIMLSVMMITPINKAWGQEDNVEPTFIGDVILITQTDTVKLEQHYPQIKTNANASLYLIGIGAVKSKITIDGRKSNNRIKKGNAFSLIVRTHNNDVNPMSVIKIFKFNKKNGYREAELNSSTTFAGLSENNLTYISYTPKKYGETSYLLNIDNNIEIGEYGVMVLNGINHTEEAMVISSFAISSLDIFDSNWIKFNQPLEAVLKNNTEMFRISESSYHNQEINENILSQKPRRVKKSTKVIVDFKIEIPYDDKIDVAYIIYDKNGGWHYLVHESYISEFKVIL